jgi:NOL1/NOP2/fmu family ribosome biogenesis protein
MFLEEIFSQLFKDAVNLRVLDLCGAPGGKSTHLSSLIGKNGYLVSNEVIISRASVLAENMSKWGLSNTIVTRSDPAAFCNLPGFFDLILVDAPCSGEGMFREQSAIEEWSPANAALCSERQKRIMLDVWPALKEGGFLVYSTCTFNPDENEKNIRWLKDNSFCEPVRIDISNYQGITEIDHEGVYGYGFYPGRIKGEGLFISVLRKINLNDKRHRKVKIPLNSRVTNDERRIAREWTCFNEDSLIKKENVLISIPCSHEEYSILSCCLRIIRPGTDICTAKGSNYLPAHDIAMSVYFKLQSFASVDVDHMNGFAYLHRDPIPIQNTVKGWNIVKYEGIPLGFINNIGSRINNYYPVGRRIRMESSRLMNANILKWEQ